MRPRKTRKNTWILTTKNVRQTFSPQWISFGYLGNDSMWLQMNKQKNRCKWTLDGSRACRGVVMELEYCSSGFCICICWYIYISTYTYTHTHIHIHQKHIDTYIYIYIYIHLYMIMYTYMYLHTHKPIVWGITILGNPPMASYGCVWNSRITWTKSCNSHRKHDDEPMDGVTIFSDKPVYKKHRDTRFVTFILRWLTEVENIPTTGDVHSNVSLPEAQKSFEHR